MAKATDHMTMDERVDEDLKELATTRNLVVRLFKTDRDDVHLARIIKAAGGFITENSVSVYLDQLRVDQGRKPRTSTVQAIKTGQRWEDLRAYMAIDNNKVPQAMSVAFKWSTTQYSEDVTGDVDVRLHWAGKGGMQGQVAPKILAEQAIELAGVSADRKYGVGNVRLMVAFNLQYVDFLNGKRRVGLNEGYMLIVATLDKVGGKTNTKYEAILSSFGFQKVLMKNSQGKAWQNRGESMEAMALQRGHGQLFLPYDGLEQGLGRPVGNVQSKPVPVNMRGKSPSIRPAAKTSRHRTSDQETTAQRLSAGVSPKAKPQDGLKVVIICANKRQLLKRRLPPSFSLAKSRNKLPRTCKQKVAQYKGDEGSPSKSKSSSHCEAVPSRAIPSKAAVTASLTEAHAPLNYEQYSEATGTPGLEPSTLALSSEGRHSHWNQVRSGRLEPSRRELSHGTSAAGKPVGRCLPRNMTPPLSNDSFPLYSDSDEEPEHFRKEEAMTTDPIQLFGDDLLADLGSELLFESATYCHSPKGSHSSKGSHPSHPPTPGFSPQSRQQSFNGHAQKSPGAGYFSPHPVPVNGMNGVAFLQPFNGPESPAVVQNQNFLYRADFSPNPLLTNGANGRLWWSAGF